MADEDFEGGGEEGILLLQKVVLAVDGGGLCLEGGSIADDGAIEHVGIRHFCYLDFLRIFGV